MISAQVSARKKPFPVAQLPNQKSRSRSRSNHIAEISWAERSTQGGENSARQKESAPIIINKEDQFTYKAPSSIHETVVYTLRKEKESLATVLAEKRDEVAVLSEQVSGQNMEMNRLDTLTR